MADQPSKSKNHSFAESSERPATDHPLDRFVGELDEAALEQIRTFDSAPDLRPVTKHGVFLWWSDRLPAWIHPDDLEVASRIVPGCRVFRRDLCENASDRELGYAKYVYGPQSLRALPIIWLEVSDEGFEVGDRVEIKSSHGKRHPMIVTIRDIIWNRHRRVIEYYVSRNGMPIRQTFEAEDLVPARRLGGYLNRREIIRANRAVLR